MNVTIRQPRMPDLPFLEDLFQSSIEDAFRKNRIPPGDELSVEAEEKANLVKRHLTGPSRMSGFRIACHDGRILGIMGHFPANRDIRSRLSLDFSRIPEIGCAYVVPGMQGRGIGRLLLDAVLLSLRAASYESFCLDCGYPVAQQIWTKLLGNPSYVEPNRWAGNQSYMIWVRHAAEITVEYPVTPGTGRKEGTD